jgi:hypothetical protein
MTLSVDSTSKRKVDSVSGEMGLKLGSQNRKRRIIEEKVLEIAIIPSTIM